MDLQQPSGQAEHVGTVECASTVEYSCISAYKIYR